MKKGGLVLSVILILLMLCTSFVACGGDSNQASEESGGSGESGSSVEGTTWVLVSGTQGDAEVSLEELTGGLTPTYEFKADGVVTNTAGDNSVDGTYTESDNVVSITLDGNTFDLNLDGDVMTMEQNGVTMNFEKQ